MNRKTFLKKLLLGAAAAVVAPKLLLAETEKRKPLLMCDEGKSGGVTSNKNQLIDFAMNFSNNYKILPAGKYYSINHKYCIEYMDGIFDIKGAPINTLYRVHTKTGVMQIDRDLITKSPHTSTIVFNAIIWCAMRWHHMRVTKDDSREAYMFADINAANLTLQNGYSAKELLVSKLEIFKTTNNSDNHYRYSKLYDAVKKFSGK